MKLTKIIALILLSTLSTWAEGGSNYSLYGIGDINSSSGPSFEAMAGTSIAMPLETAVNINNPAMWSKNINTRFQVGYRFNQNIVSDSKESLYQVNGKIDGFRVLFSIDTSLGLSAGLGLYSHSSQDYYLSTPLSYSIDSISASGKTLFQGTGGLTSFYFGGAIQPLSFLSIGLMGKAYFGVSDDIIKSVFNEYYAFESKSRLNRSFKGSSIRLGLNLELSNFNIGTFYESSPEISVKNSEVYYSASTSGLSLNRDTIIVSNSVFNIPSTYGLGISYKTGKFLIGADYKAQDFSNFNYRTYNNVKYTNGVNYSIGFLRYGSTLAGSEYMDKITYKMGLGYNKLYYSMNGNDINEMFVSLGALIPLPNTGSFDFSTSFGKRGTSENGLIQELFMRFSASLSIGDTWFKPFKRDFE